MCLWVSYKEKYGKIIIFLHPFCTASYWQSCGAQVPYMMLATHMLVPRCCGSGLGFKQCCGSITFWGGSGSGSADPYLWLMDPDPDPGSGSCYFRHWHSRCQQKTNFLTQFFLLITFWSYIYIIFQRQKVKKSHKIVGIKVFLTIFAYDRRIRIRSRIRIRIHTFD